MRSGIVFQVVLLCLIQTSAGWMLPTTKTNSQKVRSVRRIVSQPKARVTQDTSRLRKPYTTADVKMNGSESSQTSLTDNKRNRTLGMTPLRRIVAKNRGISVFFLLLLSCVAALPPVAHAALSSTTLSATAAATSTLMRPTSTQVTPSWQWVFVALATWVWQTARHVNLLPLLTQTIQSCTTWYMMQLATHPVITKSVTAGVIGVWGDSMAQSLENWLHQRRQVHKVGTSGPKYDHRRGLSILLDGLLISGPLMHFGYELFDQIMPIHAGGGSGAALLHVVADSVFLDAIFVATTFIVTGRMEGYSFGQVMPQLRKDYFPALKASWATSLLVMPIEFVCFRFLPLSYRVLAVNFIDVIWDAVISFMAHRSRHEEIVTDQNPTPEEVRTAVTLQR